MITDVDCQDCHAGGQQEIPKRLHPWLFCSNNQTARGPKSRIRALWSGHGRPVPDFDFTIDMSEALIEPLAFMSSRKFEVPTD